MLSPTNGPQQRRIMEKYLAPVFSVLIMMIAPMRVVEIAPMI
jgi:hypothetical protein